MAFMIASLSSTGSSNYLSCAKCDRRSRQAVREFQLARDKRRDRAGDEADAGVHDELCEHFGGQLGQTKKLTLGVVALTLARAAAAVRVARDGVEAALERRHVGALLVPVAHLHAVLGVEGRGAPARARLDVEVDVRVDVR